MEPWERVERKVDRLTWLIVAYIVVQVALLAADWLSTLFWIAAVVVGLYLLMLTPAARALFPQVGKPLLNLHRWVFQRK